MENPNLKKIVDECISDESWRPTKQPAKKTNIKKLNYRYLKHAEGFA